ncbi:HNH endonuclease [Fusobacterium animalis]|uniref:HNH endonuclease signature motif containing protein n=1 Tax=Fusobacterium animalis TaxID=76859 RepID=UPI0030D1953C
MKEFVPEIPYGEKKEIPDIFGPEKKNKIDPKILEKLDSKPQIEVARINRLPLNGGIWTGERGNSNWIPDDNVIPKNRNESNPEGKTNREIKDKYKFEFIPFKDGEPDFSKVVKGEVQIENFSEKRPKNYSQADIQLAKERGCTPQEIKKWRIENKYTWHECKDCKTMQLVPIEVHGNIEHKGGISEMKAKNKEV